jgi:hypothetical protein
MLLAPIALPIVLCRCRLVIVSCAISSKRCLGFKLNVLDIHISMLSDMFTAILNSLPFKTSDPLLVFGTAYRFLYNVL